MKKSLSYVLLLSAGLFIAGCSDVPTSEGTTEAAPAVTTEVDHHAAHHAVKADKEVASEAAGKPAEDKPVVAKAKAKAKHAKHKKAHAKSKKVVAKADASADKADASKDSADKAAADASKDAKADEAAAPAAE